MIKRLLTLTKLAFIYSDVSSPAICLSKTLVSGIGMTLENLFFDSTPLGRSSKVVEGAGISLNSPSNDTEFSAASAIFPMFKGLVGAF